MEQEEWEIVDRIRMAAETFPIELKDHIDKHPVGRRSRRCPMVQDAPFQEPSTVEELWRKVEEIEDAANECSEEARPEDCWSDDVVLKIFDCPLE